MFLLQSSASFAAITSYDCDDSLNYVKFRHFDAGGKIAPNDDKSDAQEHQISRSLSSLPRKINYAHNVSSICVTNAKEKFLIMVENNTNKWGAMDRLIRFRNQVKISTHYQHPS